MITPNVETAQSGNGRSEIGVIDNVHRLGTRLKKVGDIAQKYGVYPVLEALNRVESPNMSVLTTREISG